MSKYHINSNGEAKPCSATKRPCRFASDDHFASQEEAVKAIETRVEKAYKAREKARAKRRLPLTLDAIRAEDLTAAQRADEAVFESMRNQDSFQLGSAEDDDFYGSGRAQLNQEEREELEDHGVAIIGPRYGSSIPPGVRSVSLVPGTLKEITTSHFSDTFSDPDRVVHLEAEAVATLADGHRMPIRVSCRSSFQEVLDEALALTPMGILQKRARESQVHNNHSPY